MAQQTDSTPAEAQLLVDFVNTLDIDDDIEQIGSPDELAAWLGEHGLMQGGSARPEDVALAQRVRESLRALMHANNGEPLDPDAVDELNKLSVETPLVLRFSSDGSTELAPGAEGAAAGLTRLMGNVYALMAEGKWQRVKACPADSCEWAFYDQSKNRSRTWCSMEVCGNRSKARAYRRRHT
ncbi:MAG TPA: CGNR zinc finger domain-containing protein [Thermoleophilaceae bacterium]